MEYYQTIPFSQLNHDPSDEGDFKTSLEGNLDAYYMLKRLPKRQKEIARLQKIADDQAEAKRRYRMHLFRQKLHIYVALILGIITIVLSIAGLMWLVSWDKEWRWGY